MIKKRQIKEWFIWYWPGRENILGWTFIVLIFSLLVLLINGNPFEDSFNKKKFVGIANDGVVTNIATKEYLSQDETGNKIRTLGYVIEYTYYVDGNLYYGTQFLNKSMKNSIKLDNILQGNYEIRYKDKEPDKSIIIQKEKKRP